MTPPPAGPPPGLCATCAHHRKVGNRAGSIFFLCERAREDSRFPRYPPLPVLRCEGYEKGPPDPWQRFADNADHEES